MEKLIGTDEITEQDILILNPDTIQEARKHLSETKRLVGLHWKCKLTVQAYCDYYGIDYNLVIVMLNPYRKPQ